MPNNHHHQRTPPKKYNFCTSKLKTTTEKFVWTIDNFSKRQKKCGEYLQSTKFISTAPNGQVLKWRMEMYPNGFDEEFKDYISLYLTLIDPNREEVEAKFGISILAPDGEQIELMSSLEGECLKFNRVENKYGHEKLIKREEIFTEENDFLDDDRLTIVCKLIVQQESVKKAKLPDVEVPESRAVEDMSNLYEKSLFTDCKIISEDEKKYEVHKCILGCRSPVFAAMFEHEMLEKNSNTIEIVDIKGEVIDKMLRFIYSGKEPDLEAGMAEDLLIAADKYELTRLKLICERKLISSLVAENACGLLLLANLYSAEHLKVQAMNFIKMHMNEIMGTEGWKEILADAQLMQQILKAMAK